MDVSQNRVLLNFPLESHSHLHHGADTSMACYLSSLIPPQDEHDASEAERVLLKLYRAHIGIGGLV